jgi:hypothetical protein
LRRSGTAASIGRYAEEIRDLAQGRSRFFVFRRVEFSLSQPGKQPEEELDVIIAAVAGGDTRDSSDKKGVGSGLGLVVLPRINVKQAAGRQRRYHRLWVVDTGPAQSISTNYGQVPSWRKRS